MNVVALGCAIGLLVVGCIELMLPTERMEPPRLVSTQVRKTKHARSTKLVAFLGQGGVANSKYTREKRKQLVTECSDFYHLHWGEEPDPLADVHRPCHYSDGVLALHQFARAHHDYEYYVYLDDDQPLHSEVPGKSAAEVVCDRLREFRPWLATLQFKNHTVVNQGVDATLVGGADDEGGHIWHRSVADAMFPFWESGSFKIWWYIDYTAALLRPHKFIRLVGVWFGNKRHFNRKNHSAEEVTLRNRSYVSHLMEQVRLCARPHKHGNPIRGIDTSNVVPVTYSELVTVWNTDCALLREYCSNVQGFICTLI